MLPLQWFKIAESKKALAELCNPLHKVFVSERWILIYKNGEEFHASSARCPHAGFDLSDEQPDEKGRIVCPLHGYTFCLKTGRNVSGEGYKLYSYPFEERNDGIYIGSKELLF